MPVLDSPESVMQSIETLGKIKPRRVFLADAILGAKVLSAVDVFATGGAVVVTRGHVLGIETGEGVCALCRRIARRKQWGAAHWKRRRGTVVLRDGAGVTAEVIADVAAAGFAGLAVLRSPSTETVDGAGLASVNAAGLAVVLVNDTGSPVGDE